MAQLSEVAKLRWDGAVELIRVQKPEKVTIKKDDSVKDGPSRTKKTIIF